MAVLRIVHNLPATGPARLAEFPCEVLGLEAVTELAFAHTPRDGSGPLQLGLAREGAGTPLPVLSVEVDDLQSVLACARSFGAGITCGQVDGPWGSAALLSARPRGQPGECAVPQSTHLIPGRACPGHTLSAGRRRRPAFADPRVL